MVLSTLSTSHPPLQVASAATPKAKVNLAGALGSLIAALHGLEDLQEAEEEVDDVEVEPHGGPHVLVHAVPQDELVRVVHDVAAEDARPRHREQEVHGVAHWEEPAEEAGADESHQAAEQHGAQEAEVLPLLHPDEGVDGQAGDDERGEHQRLEDDGSGVHRAYHAHAEREGASPNRQQS
eukprot:CAMPEP_0118931614 /NCGR_PEP_ID=MMETSP1169-20130426/7893_1 /TAXON_ID=36882 /ORGANISM="Pyramimonas obovata, Strain CCMP722" /LENGTH=179 /DNA_ID=CAMNT_0006874131 /DNA_START=840 /DNA_END=1380 /DNA_ORIENTATION=+